MTPLCHTTTAVLLRATCLGVCALLLGSCVPQPAPVRIPLRGTVQRLSPEQTRQKYGCVASQGQPFHLEYIEIRPDIAQPGELINHRLFYYLCAPSLKANVTRVVFSPEKEVYREVTNYEFEAGAWAIGTLFVLPTDIPSGAYKVDTIISYQNKTVLKHSAPFSVKRPSSGVKP